MAEATPSRDKLLGKVKNTTIELGPCFKDLKIIDYVKENDIVLIFQDTDSTEKAKAHMADVSNYLLKFSIFEAIVSDQILHKLSLESSWASSLNILDGFKDRTNDKIKMFKNLVNEGELELQEIAFMKEQNINREFADQVLGNLIMDIHRRDQSLNHLNAVKEYEILKTIKECEANGKVIAGNKNIECLEEQLSLVESEISGNIELSLDSFKNHLDKFITEKEKLRNKKNPLEKLRKSYTKTLKKLMSDLIPCFEDFIYADCLNNDLISKLDASEKIIENNINIEEAKKSLSICITAEPYLLAELSNVNDEIFKIGNAFEASSTTDYCKHHANCIRAINRNTLNLQRDLQSLSIKTELRLNITKRGDFVTKVELEGSARPEMSFTSLNIINPEDAPLSSKTLALKNQLDLLEAHKAKLLNQIAKKAFYENQLQEFIAKKEEIIRQREASSNALKKKNEQIKINYQTLLNITSIQGLKYKSEYMTLLVIIFFKNFSLSRKPGVCSRSKPFFERTEILANEFYKEIIKSKQIKVSCCCGNPIRAVHECDSFSIEDTIKLMMEGKVLMGFKDLSRQVKGTTSSDESYRDSMFYCLRDCITLIVLQQQIDLNIDYKAALRQMKGWEKEGIDLMNTLNYRKIAMQIERDKFPHK